MWKITRFSSKEWKSWESSPQSRHVPWEGTKPWLSGSYVEAKLLSHSDRTLFSILALCTLDFPCRHSLCWASQDNLRVWWLVISHRIQHVVMLMGKIYYTKGYKTKSAKGKRCMGQSLEEASHKLLRVLSPWSYQDVLNFSRTLWHV